MKQREILFIAISIFILVLAYIGFSIYHNAVTSTIPSALSIQIIPIDPSFDLQTIDALTKRVHVQGNFQTPNASVSGTPLIPTVVPTIVPSPTQTQTQTATNSGKIQTP